ncbi:Hypothetical predicted protein, partial [Paramuricea clavata]
ACSSNHSIGLSDGSFTERGLIATTFLDVYHTPNWARLHQSKAWSPAILNDHSIEQYVQLTFFGGQFLVKNVAMQGSPLFDWWVTKFRISTSNDGEHFVTNTEEYDGNYDGSSVVMVTLQNSTPSIYFRVIPTRWNNNVALRLELYGCFEYIA